VLPYRFGQNTFCNLQSFAEQIAETQIAETSCHSQPQAQKLNNIILIGIVFSMFRNGLLAGLMEN